MKNTGEINESRKFSYRFFFSTQNDANETKTLDISEEGKKRQATDTENKTELSSCGCAVTVLSRCDLKIARYIRRSQNVLIYTVQAQKRNNKHTEPLLNIIRLARPFTDYYRLLQKC